MRISKGIHSGHEELAIVVPPGMAATPSNPLGKTEKRTYVLQVNTEGEKKSEDGLKRWKLVIEREIEHVKREMSNFSQVTYTQTVIENSKWLDNPKGWAPTNPMHLVDEPPAWQQEGHPRES